MNLFNYILLFLFATVCTLSTYYLLICLKKEKLPVSLLGVFCMALGIFLLILDLILIAITQGPQYIPDYLLFNRLVSDSGFAGRWMLTVYLFIGTGLIISFYLLARNLLKKFNKGTK
jgi:uncharacterized membrane protein YciS (DUF1049 family)